MLLESKEFHVDVTEAAVNAVDLLAAETGFSKQKIKQAMQKGAVWMTDKKGTQRLRRQSKIVHGSFVNETVTYTSEIDNKSAISHVTLLQHDEDTNTSLLLVDIETGRKHQIRIHLSEAGFPVVGDRLYGNDSQSTDLQLTAFKLSFTNPSDGIEKCFVLDESLQPRFEN